MTPYNVQVSPDGKFAWVIKNGEPGSANGVTKHKGADHGGHGANPGPSRSSLILRE